MNSDKQSKTIKRDEMWWNYDDRDCMIVKNISTFQACLVFPLKETIIDFMSDSKKLKVFN